MRRKNRPSLWMIASLLLLMQWSFAQTVSLEKDFKNLKARSIGPAGMSGRVTTIDAVYNNPDIVYVGSASGGVWKTTSGGAKWEPVFDDQPIQNIGAIAIQQSNPSVVWVGTGEGNPRNSINLGGGIFKSLDGGKNWITKKLPSGQLPVGLRVHPDNTDWLYLGFTIPPPAQKETPKLYK